MFSDYLIKRNVVLLRANKIWRGIFCPELEMETSKIRITQHIIRYIFLGGDQRGSLSGRWP